MFSHTFNMCSYLMWRNQISHSYIKQTFWILSNICTDRFHIQKTFKKPHSLFCIIHRSNWGYLCAQNRLFFLNVSVFVNNIESPTRYNNNDLLISKISSTCFGQFFAYLQERKTEIYSMWYCVLVLW